MNPLLIALTVVGAVAVLFFATHLVIRIRAGRPTPASRALLLAAGIAGGVCAVLGVAMAVVES